MNPTLVAFGSNSLTNLIWSATGLISDVPDTFPPGFWALLIIPDATGSVTAVNNTGVSISCFSNSWTNTWATGVAIAKIKSLLLTAVLTEDTTVEESALQL